MQQSARHLAAHLIKRAPFLAMRKGVELLSGLIVFSVLAQTLSRSDFAIYNLVLTYVGIIRVTSFPGLGNALTQSFARGRRGGFRRATMVSLIGSAAGSCLLLVAAWWHLVQVSDDAMTVSLVAAALGFPLSSGLLYWRNTAVGAEQFGRLLILDSAAFVLRAGTIVLCAFTFQGQLFPIILASLLAPGAVNVYATIQQIRAGTGDAEIEPGATRYGVLASLYELPALLAQRLDQLVLFYLISPEALSIYAVALRFPIIIQAIMGESIAVFDPVFARETSHTPSLSRFSLLVSLVFSGLCIVIAIAIIPYLLPILVGSKYNDAIIYAQILTAGAAAGTAGQMHFRFVKSHSKSRPLLQITLILSAMTAAITLLLTYFFGLNGIVAAFIINGLVASVVTGVLTKVHFPIKNTTLVKGSQ